MTICTYQYWTFDAYTLCESSEGNIIHDVCRFKTNSFEGKARLTNIMVPPIALTDELNTLPSPTPNYWESDLSRQHTEEDDMSSPSMHMAGSAIHAVRKNK